MIDEELADLEKRVRYGQSIGEIYVGRQFTPTELLSILADARSGKRFQTIADDILSIMQTYDEQLEKRGWVDTPGGLEHMGDVWALLSRWRDIVK